MQKSWIFAAGGFKRLEAGDGVWGWGLGMGLGMGFVWGGVGGLGGEDLSKNRLFILTKSFYFNVFQEIEF